MSEPLLAVANGSDIKCSTRDRQDLAQEGQWRPLLTGVGVVQWLVQNHILENANSSRIDLHK